MFEFMLLVPVNMPTRHGASQAPRFGGDWVFAVALLAAGVLMVIQAVKARRARRRKKEARALKKEIQSGGVCPRRIWRN